MDEIRYSHCPNNTFKSFQPIKSIILFSFSNLKIQPIVYLKINHHFEELLMKDQKRKVEVIRSIEQLQLPNQLIQALDDAQLAENVVHAINYLKNMSHQWH